MTVTLLVPLDGSPSAERALAIPVELAARTAVRVVLCRVVERSANVSGQADGITNLERQAAALNARGVLAATIVLHGQVAPAIVDEARRQRADLIVMVRRDHGGLSGWLHHSVTSGVLAATPVPLLLLRAAADLPSPLFQSGLRLIVGLDGSSHSKAALPIARHLAERLGAPIRLVRAISNEVILAAPVFTADGRSIETFEEEGALVLSRAREELTVIGESLGAGPGMVECDVRFGEPIDVLSAVEAEYAPTLLVLATHGYTGLQRSALGSVAASFLRRDRHPVLLVRPPEHTGPFTPQRITEAAVADPPP